MSLKIIKAGVLDTIQDLGRYHYQHLGINPGGVMDKYAMQVTNMLAGNSMDEAVIEMHFPASVFMFTKPALIALGGADFSASINGEPIPNYHTLLVCKNDLLQFHKPVKGARAYLAVQGGFVLNKWMKSYSTNLKANAGGYKGRALQKEDELFLNKSFAFSKKADQYFVLPWQADVSREIDHKEIFVIPGNEWGRLTTEASENFLMTSFVITNQSDRMGYRLNNIPLPAMHHEEIISSGVSFGTVQLLPDGKLIILMADHQTTGGYPRIAHVISAHHSRLAQMQAGDKIQFRLTDPLTAESLNIKQQQHLLQLKNACKFRLEELINATGN